MRARKISESKKKMDIIQSRAFSTLWRQIFVILHTLVYTCVGKAEISALAIIILMLRNDSSYGSHENREEQMKPEETVSKCKQG